MKKGAKTGRFGTSSRINHDSSTYYGSRLSAELGANNMVWGGWQWAANPVLRDVHEYILVFSKGALGRKKREGQ
jgi:hypothetical protein